MQIKTTFSFQDKACIFENLLNVCTRVSCSGHQMALWVGVHKITLGIKVTNEELYCIEMRVCLCIYIA